MPFYNTADPAPLYSGCQHKKWRGFLSVGFGLTRIHVHHKGTLMPPTRFTQVPVAITSTTEYTIDLQQAQIED